MSNFKKVVLTPFESDDQYGEGIDDIVADEPMPNASTAKKGNFIRSHAIQRQRNILSIIMKLAAISGYDEQGHIKRKDGSYAVDTDLVPLLFYALQKERTIKGIDTFAELLREAKVPPSLITNENLKQRMITRPMDIPPSVRQEQSEPIQEDQPPPPPSILDNIQVQPADPRQRGTYNLNDRDSVVVSNKRKRGGDSVTNPVIQSKRKSHDDDAGSLNKIQKVSDPRTWSEVDSDEGL